MMETQIQNPMVVKIDFPKFILNANADKGINAIAINEMINISFMLNSSNYICNLINQTSTCFTIQILFSLYKFI